MSAARPSADAAAQATFTPGPWSVKRHGVIVGGVSRQYTNGEAQDQLAMAAKAAGAAP